MNKVVIVVIVLVILGFGGFFLLSRQGMMPENPVSTMMEDKPPQDTKISFDNPKKSAHYETNTPSHGAILPAAPVNVVIDFNFDLAEGSNIRIDGPAKSIDASKTEDYGEGPTIIDDNKLSMRRKMAVDSPDSLYTVIYKACWPDKTCHDGSFQFTIDREKANSYIDLTGQKEVTINLENFKIVPQNIKISRGTKVVWVNKDSVEHYVNTDSHPSHTYHLAQNSRALKSGERYSVTFDTPGVYPYHCSAHADTMIGSIVVE